MGPFLFQDGDQDKVEFVEELSIRFEVLFRIRVLYNIVDDKVAYTLETLVDVPLVFIS